MLSGSRMAQCAGAYIHMGCWRAEQRAGEKWPLIDRLMKRFILVV